MAMFQIIYPRCARQFLKVEFPFLCKISKNSLSTQTVIPRAIVLCRSQTVFQWHRLARVRLPISRFFRL